MNGGVTRSIYRRVLINAASHNPDLKELISWKIHDKSIVAKQETEGSGGFNKRLLATDTLVPLNAGPDGQLIVFDTEH